MTKAKPLPPIDLLREVLAYDPDTGVITWRISMRSGIRRGTIAGSVNIYGYRRIALEGRNYAAHRIAYALYHGCDPHPQQIDHINRDKADNRICNLRIATATQNCNNRVYTNTARPNIYEYCGEKKAVRITYPDGRGTIVCDSVSTAARILNRSIDGITNIIKNGGILYYGRGRSARPSGITLTHA